MSMSNKLHFTYGILGGRSAGYWGVRELPGVRIARAAPNWPEPGPMFWQIFSAHYESNAADEGCQLIDNNNLEAQEFRTRTAALQVLQLAYDLSLSADSNDV